jgi:NAD(P)-dependent dehydrogenase (short-subunit alcohol dehydrogenase family)
VDERILQTNTIIQILLVSLNVKEMRSENDRDNPSIIMLTSILGYISRETVDHWKKNGHGFVEFVDEVWNV